jgi:hypothetical protein
MNSHPLALPNSVQPLNPASERNPVPPSENTSRTNLARSSIQRLKNLLQLLFPNAYRMLHRYLSPFHILQRLFILRHSCVVLEGPFSGMKYISKSSGSRLMPKLLGTYEQELHGWIEELKALRPSLIIDIGAAEGYYTVGLARMLPSALVKAYEMDPRARLLCQRLAKLNSVESRVQILEQCTVENLRLKLAPGAFILCDSEGAEIALLDPAAAPELKSCHILVETHDCFSPGITEGLVKRFEASHNLRCCEAKPREAAAGAKYILNSDFRRWSVDEDRAPAPDGNQKWLFLTPKNP